MFCEVARISHLSPVQTIQHSIQHCIQQMLDDDFTPRLNDPTMLDEISPRAKKRPGTEFTNVANYKQRCYAHARFQQLFSPRPNDPTMRWIIQHFWSHSNSIQHLLDGPTWWPNDPTFAVQHLLDAMLDAMLDRLDRALWSSIAFHFQSISSLNFKNVTSLWAHDQLIFW